VDALIDQARREIDQDKRKILYAQIQRILAEDLPYINFWYLDNVLVHTGRVRNLHVSPSGDYEFLKTAEIVR
jgi:peptide/nickel transport system substrate-binding protein